MSRSIKPTFYDCSTILPIPIFRLRSREHEYIDIEKFLNDPKLADERTKHAIFIRGAPGCGKTYLANLIADKLKEKTKHKIRILTTNSFYVDSPTMSHVDDYKMMLLELFKSEMKTNFYSFYIVEVEGGSIYHLSRLYHTALIYGSIAGCVIEMNQRLDICYDYAVHRRPRNEIQDTIDEILDEPPPPNVMLIDATSIYRMDDLSEKVKEFMRKSIENNNFSVSQHTVSNDYDLLKKFKSIISMDLADLEISLVDPEIQESLWIWGKRVTEESKNSQRKRKKSKDFPNFEAQKVLHYHHQSQESFDESILDFKICKIIDYNHRVSSRFKEFINDCELLHSAIKSGDFHFVKHHLTDSSDKCILSNNNESAMAVALKHGQLEIYKYLLSRGLKLGKHEIKGNIVKSLSQDLRRSLTVIDVFSKNISGNIVVNLMKNSKILVDTSANRTKYIDFTRNCFETLDEIELVKPILEAVCYSNLKSIFDFRFECFYFHMFIGDIFKKDSEMETGDKIEKENFFEILGSIVHEMCHCAMKLLYNNSYKPYCSDDDEASQLFSEVVRKCNEKLDVSHFKTGSNSCTHKNELESELIVRVPQLLVRFKDNSDQLRKKKEEFSSLFKYYEEKTIIDLQRELPLLKARHDLTKLWNIWYIRDQSSSLSCLEKNSKVINGLRNKLQPNIPITILTTTLIDLVVNILETYFKEHSLVYVSLIDLKNETVFDAVLKAHSLISKPTLIIYCDEHQSDKDLIIIKKFVEHKISQRIIFLKRESTQQVQSTWPEEILQIAFKDFTLEFQNMLLQTFISFQGEEICFKDLYDAELMEQLPDIFLRRLFYKEKIEIGFANYFDNEFYVERKFLIDSSQTYKKMLWNSNSNSDKEFILKDILSLNTDQTTFVISDEPGMGKSTELQIISKRLKEKFPTSWIAFIDLKMFINQKDSEVYSLKDIVNFFCDKILKLEDFEACIFNHLFNENRVIFLMDGFDEINHSSKLFVLKLLDEIKLTENQLWLSTRPDFKAQLENVLKPMMLKFKPLTMDNQIEFLLKFWRQTEQIEHTESLQEFSKFFGDSISPLLLRIFAETFHKYGNYGLKNLNLFSIYDEFTKNLYQRYWNHNTTVCENLYKISNNLPVLKSHEKVALETVFKNEELVKNLKAEYSNELEDFTKDEIIRVGLMYHDGECFNFIHQTFAEFFVAKYVVKRISCRSEKSLGLVKIILKKIFNLPKSLSNKIHDINNSNYLLKYKMILTFVDNALKLSQNKNCVKANGAFVKFFIHNALSCKKDISLLLKLLEIRCFKLVEIIIGIPECSKFLIERNENDENILMAATKYCDLDFIKKLLMEIKMTIRLNLLFLETDYYGKTVLHFSIQQQNVKIFNFFLKEAQKCFESIEIYENFIVMTDKKGQNILHHSLMFDCNFEDVTRILSEKISLGKFESLLIQTDNSEWSLLHHACFFSPRNIEILCKVLKYNLNRCDLREQLFGVNIVGETALQYAAENFIKNTFQTLWNFVEQYLTPIEIKQVLSLTSQIEETIFHSAMKNVDVETFNFIQKLYNRFLTVDEINEILKLSDHKQTLLHVIKSIQKNNPESKTLKLLQNFLSENLDSNAISGNKFYSNFLYRN